MTYAFAWATPPTSALLPYMICCICCVLTLDGAAFALDDELLLLLLLDEEEPLIFIYAKLGIGVFAICPVHIDAINIIFISGLLLLFCKNCGCDGSYTCWT